MKTIKIIKSQNRKAVEITEQNGVYICFFFTNYSERQLSYFKSSKDYKSLKTAEKAAINFNNQ